MSCNKSLFFMSLSTARGNVALGVVWNCTQTALVCQISWWWCSFSTYISEFIHTYFEYFRQTGLIKNWTYNSQTTINVPRKHSLSPKIPFQNQKLWNSNFASLWWPLSRLHLPSPTSPMATKPPSWPPPHWQGVIIDSRIVKEDVKLCFRGH